jgi:hypothetical protein
MAAKSMMAKQRRRLGVAVMRVAMMGMARALIMSMRMPMIVVMVMTVRVAGFVIVVHRPQFAPKTGANRERA